mgnify:CR=1 FL=1|tara:strand:+ start:1567 stop:2433 length:867 start_codon:yes stop_codon:yes gene_type:complete
MQLSHENSSFEMNFSLNCQGKLIDLSTPKVMGIINITPDSFYDGGNYLSQSSILKQAEKLLVEGATFLDLGAFSSRPGADLITEKEEIERLKPALQAISKAFPHALLSIDTYRSTVAKMAISEGAHIINDISGGLFDDQMFSTIAELKVPYILMHMKGKPKSMQRETAYQDVVGEVFAFFQKQLTLLNQLGVADVILDPGFGFGKSLADNYTLLKNQSFFRTLNCPLLIGLSRKSMIQKVIETEAAEALNGTTAAHVLSLLNGANILRVHDAKEALEAIQIVDFYQKQ